MGIPLEYNLYIREIDHTQVFFFICCITRKKVYMPKNILGGIVVPLFKRKPVDKWFAKPGSKIVCLGGNE